MLIKKVKVEEVQENPYDWPENYYMEADPALRKEILETRLQEDDSEQLLKRKELFAQRYALGKKGQYKDTFMEACIDLMYLGQQSKSVFSSRANKKMIEKIISQLCLDREEEFGTEVLYEELCHLIKVYITIALKDDSYRSVILQVLKMSDARCKEKIKSDLKLFGETIPKAYGKENEFRLWKRAIAHTQKTYL